MLILKNDHIKESFIITDSAFNIINDFIQRDPASFEAGGQLFAMIKDKDVIIEVATPPDTMAKRSRYSFWPFRKKERQDIEYYFKKGLHYVGDWHTHPQKFPIPSKEDLDTVKSIFCASAHELNFLILLIIGNSGQMHDIWVGLINATEVVVLSKKCCSYKGSP